MPEPTADQLLAEGSHNRSVARRGVLPPCFAPITRPLNLADAV